MELSGVKLKGRSWNEDGDILRNWRAEREKCKALTLKRNK
jgi:hypothetical protein